jgi:molybdate transport system ATP-binding protein
MKNAATPPPFLELSKATFSEYGQPVLENVDWEIRTGEHWAITGPMGAGKTRLLQAIRGEFLLKAGKIHYHFLDTGTQPYDLPLRIRRQVAMVSFSEDSQQFSYANYFYQQRYHASITEGILTAEDFLLAAGYSPGREDHRAIIHTLGIDSLRALELIKLSNGQIRRVRIARALLQNPRLLMLDNPYIGLDAGGRRTFNRFLDQLLADKPIQLLLVARPGEFPESITHVLHLENKQIRAKTRRSAISGNTPGLSPPPPPPASLLSRFAPAESGKFRTVARLEQVSVRYGDKAVVDTVSWTVNRGEKWALLGANGSGKSTLLSLMYGDHPQAYANRIYLFDRRRGTGESIWEIKQQIGFTSPELHLYFSYRLSCREVVLSGLSDALEAKCPPTAPEAALLEELFAYFGKPDLPERPFTRVSTGEQRLVLFIRALIKNPPLLLLDEPFQAFDEPSIERARTLLDALAHPQSTLIFITHYPPEIPECVRKVAVLENGRLRVEGVDGLMVTD